MNRILVVDDDEISRDMIEHTLGKAGYAVETAADGREAFEVLRSGRCRLVISDWNMPEMSGIELCRAIREADWDGYLYTILLTSHCSPEEIVEGMSAGADDFITKPFNPAELVVRVRAGARILSLEMRDVAIFALAKLAESRDTETGRHLERVQCYSRTLAQHLACESKYRPVIDREFVRLIYQTSPLHDIGKVAIPDCVLRKPGRLSDDEFAVMKKHVDHGASTLEAALERFPEAQFLKVARDIAATHHERWDGRGYPRGLSGENIPLAGRIVAVADVYDALTSRRCYKEAFTHETARSIIVGDAGSHFDPDIVAAFLRAEDEIIAIRARYNDEEPAPVPAPAKVEREPAAAAN
jgi:putative two-component system response regulator